MDICPQTLPVLDANSFPRAKLEKKCEAWGTDNVQGLINEHIFALYRGYCVSYPSNTVASHRKIFTNNSPFTVQDVNFSMFSGIIL